MIPHLRINHTTNPYLEQGTALITPPPLPLSLLDFDGGGRQKYYI